MIAFLFPGQGSQEIGMGSDLSTAHPDFKKWIERASDQVGIDLLLLARRGPQRELSRTRFLQPLLVWTSLGYHRSLVDRGLRPDFVLGHSLGEISALAASGVVAPEVAIDIAVRRGAWMEEAAAHAEGGMLAVTTLDRDGVLASFRELDPAGQLALAADNTPDQLVFSGPAPLLDAAATRLARERLGTSRRLVVSGPWHSPAMASAQETFGRYLANLSFHPPICPLVLNVTGVPESDPAAIRRGIIRCLTEPVLWRPSMAWLRQARVQRLVEIGPGRVLAGLARANGFGNEVQVSTVGSLKAADVSCHPRLCDSPAAVPPDRLS
ncbi:MAG: ACP S-malonyltransferase [Verrucomicrobiales bacterium]|nr:ACP S-malonyltransferase [Verrucomicrobiales bacterium]